MSHEAMRSVRSHSFAVDLPAERAFGLFTPEGERAWAEGWNPRYMHPAGGRTEAGMVFTTGHGPEETIWTMMDEARYRAFIEGWGEAIAKRMGPTS